jgi:hypothetical protein
MLRRNCLLIYVTEGKIGRRAEVTERRGRRRKQVLDYLKGKTEYCKLKEEALDRNPWEEAMDLS